MKIRWQGLLLFGLLCCLWLPVAAEEESPSEQQLIKKEQTSTQKSTTKKPPAVEIHGDFRLLYGEGRFEGNAGPYQFKSRLIMPTQRTRVFITGHINDMWVVKTEFEDNRNFHDHSTDHHVYMGRLYLEGENKANTKYMLGRFNYYVFDGNTMDTRVDGARIRVGHDDTVTTSLFYGRLVRHEAEKKKEGVIGTLTHEQGKLLSRLAYYNFHSYRDALSGDLDRQEIWSWNNRYTINKDFNTTLELLWAKGKNDHDHYTDTDHGFVWSLNFHPEVNPAKPGQIDAWIKYYRQPRASIITHTMDGDPFFFQRMGFAGWGARVDYVLSPGLVWAVEGFIMHNYREDTVSRPGRNFSNMTEKIIGTSLTLYI